MPNLLELDFDTIKENFKNYLKGNQTEFTDYDFEGSAFSVLNDILGYNTFYNSFYANMLSQELFLNTAEIRENVVKRANFLGYLPRSLKASTILIDLTVIPDVNDPTPAEIILEKHSKFNAANESEGTSFTFVNTQEETLTWSETNQEYTNNTPILLLQGIPIEHTFFVDVTNLNQRFIIPNANIDLSTLNVVVYPSVDALSGTLYKHTDTVINIDNQSLIYFINEVNEGYYELLFGDGIHGKKLGTQQNGEKIVITYLSTEGAIANNIKTFSFNETVGRTGSTQYSTVSLNINEGNIKSLGGEDKESIASIKKSAIGTFEMQNRCVTAEDYERMILINKSDVSNIKVWGGQDAIPKDYGKVFIAVTLTGDTPLTGQQKTEIENIVRPKQVGAITPVVVDPIKTYIELDTALKYDSKLTSKFIHDIENKIKTDLVDFSNNTLNKFTKNLYYSSMVIIINNSDSSIIANSSNIRLTQETIVSFTVETQYEFYFYNQIKHPFENYEGAVTSNYFNINDNNGILQRDCYIEDLNQVLRIVFIDSDLNKVVLFDDIGRVDYNTGTISFFFRPSDMVDPVLKISVEPHSSDIDSNFEQVLLIRQEDINITSTDINVKY